MSPPHYNLRVKPIPFFYKPVNAFEDLSLRASRRRKKVDTEWFLRKRRQLQAEEKCVMDALRKNDEKALEDLAISVALTALESWEQFS